MSSVTPIHEMLKAILRQADFKKKGNVWSKIIGNIEWIIALQKSQWSRQYYINAYAYLIDSNGKSSRATDQILFWGRLKHLCRTESMIEIDKLLNLELDQDIASNMNTMGSFLTDIVLPTISRIDSIDEMAKAASEGSISSSVLTRGFRDRSTLSVGSASSDTKQLS